MITLGSQVVVQHRSANLHRIKVGARRVTTTETGPISVKVNTIAGWYEDWLEPLTKVPFHHFHKGFY